jgi:large subunit ribosomal protein L24e
MVEKRNCSFCGEPIEPGTGKMYVKKDGTVYNFCSNKCKKNRIDIGRVPRRTRWTVRYAELKASSLKRERREEPEEEREVKPKKKAPVKKAAAKPVRKPEKKVKPPATPIEEGEKGDRPGARPAQKLKAEPVGPKAAGRPESKTQPTVKPIPRKVTAEPMTEGTAPKPRPRKLAGKPTEKAGAVARTVTTSVEIQKEGKPPTRKTQEAKEG